MNTFRNLVRGALACAVAATAVLPAGATTLVRAGLDELVDENAAIAVGEVVDVHSYWNEEGTFILTDVRISTSDILKGDLLEKSGEVTITVLGGSVGDLTTLIVGGPELVPGSSYVLFLNREDLPGAKGALTVRDLCQGVFDIRMDKDGLRAVSQANGHPLVPDALGYADAPGGVEGFPLRAMMDSIRDLAEAPRNGSRGEW